MKAIKTVLLIIYIILFLLIVFIVNGRVESHFVNSEIEAFKARGQLVYEDERARYFAVEAIYDYEDTSREVLRSFVNMRIGSQADIFVTSRNPLPGNPFVGFLSENMWLGHAALVLDDDGRQTAEITGNLSPEENVVSIWSNTWISGDSVSPQIALLRLKNTDEGIRNAITEYALSQVGKPYNYTFLFNTNRSYYCSDFVSRASLAGGININYDHLATTGSDMIVSDKTYLAYYRERQENNGNITYDVYFLTDKVGDE